MAKCDINNKQRLFDVLKSKDIVDMANDNNIEYSATLSGNILNISVKSGVDNAYIVQSLIENAVNNSFPGILLSSRTEDGYINTILFTERVNNTIKDKRNKRIAKLRFDRSIVRNDGEVISPSGYPAIPMANDRKGIIKNLEKQIHQEATNAWDLGEVADVSNRGVGKLINEYYKSDVVSYYDEGTDLTFPRVQVPEFLVDIYYNELLDIIKERKEKWSSDLMEQSSFWDENGDADQYNSISTTNTNIGSKAQYSQYLNSLNRPNTNPILQNNQQEQVKKFAELQERLNNKEFTEGAKNVFESSPDLQQAVYEGLGILPNSKGKFEKLEALTYNNFLKIGKENIEDILRYNLQRFPISKPKVGEPLLFGGSYSNLEPNFFKDLLYSKVYIKYEDGQFNLYVTNSDKGEQITHIDSGGTREEEDELLQNMLPGYNSFNRDWEIYKKDISSAELNEILNLSDKIEKDNYTEEDYRDAYKNWVEKEENRIKNPKITVKRKQQALDVYTDYIARVSLGIIKNPSSGDYNYTSQVKDIVYHGTGEKFDIFDFKLVGKTTKGFANAAFFTNDKNWAFSRFALADTHQVWGKEGVVLSALINIKNPKIFDTVFDFNKSIEEGIYTNLNEELNEKLRDIFPPVKSGKIYFVVNLNKQLKPEFKFVDENQREEKYSELTGKYTVPKNITEQEYLNTLSKEEKNNFLIKKQKLNDIISSYSTDIDKAIKGLTTKTAALSGKEDSVIQTHPNTDTKEYAVFEPEKIHILGGKNDIQGFKEFVQGKQTFDKELAQKIQDKLQKLYPEIKLNITNNPVWEQGDNVFNQEEYSNQVIYGLKATKTILDNLTKIKQWESNKSIDKNTLWRKIGELGISKQQLDLLKESDGNTIEEKLASFVANYSYTVEINTAKDSNKLVDWENNPNTTYFEFTVDDIKYTDSTYGYYYKRLPNTPKDVEISEEEYNKAKIKSSKNLEAKPTQYYSNLTVPGGTNYTEQEISTPLITPSIKGHAQFATDNGIGWFRSDDKADRIYNKEEEVKDENGNILVSGGYSYIKSNNKARRILELQSDLFQKGRDKNVLTRGSITHNGLEYYASSAWTSGAGVESKEVRVIKQGNKVYGETFNPLESLPKEVYDYFSNRSKEALTHNDNQFLQLLNKDNNWVTFFIKSIIADSAKKGYEKVLFPLGDTASKIEGHTTLEEFKKQKEDRIKELETASILKNKTVDGFYYIQRYLEDENGNEVLTWRKVSNENGREKTATNDEINQLKERFSDETKNEINRLKQELERVEKEGFGALKPIYNFYENTVTNILNKTYGKENVKQITDEYGNKWNEVTLNQARDLANILLQRNEANQIIGQANIKAMTVLIDAVNQRSDTIPHEYAHHYIAWFRNTPIVQEAIKKWGSEEALVQSIGEQVVKQKGEAYNWWNKFVKWIMNQFNSLSKLQKEELTQILTDAFLTRQDLGSKADIQGFKDFVQGKQFQKLTAEEGEEIINNETVYTSLEEKFQNLNNVNYQLKAINILSSDKAKQVFEKGTKNNWSLDKILTELQVPKEQKQIILDENLEDKSKLDFIESDNTRDDNIFIKDQLPIKYLKEASTTNYDGTTNTRVEKLKNKYFDKWTGEPLTNLQVIDISEITKPEDTSLEEILSKIKLSEANQILLEKIKPLVKGVKIQYVNQFFRSRAGALYSDKYNTIRINNSERGISLEEKIMHELLHAATFRKITYFETNTKGLSKKELEALNELENIRKVLKEASDKYWDNRTRFARSVNPLEGYRTDSIHEIISYAFTNKEFRDAISEIPYKGDKSILDKLIELISNIFKVKQNTILQNLIANAEVLLETKDNLREEIITSLLADNSEIQYSKRESNSNTIDRLATSYSQMFEDENTDLDNALKEKKLLEYLNKQIKYIDEEGNECAKFGLKTGVSGTNWRIEENLNWGKKHSEGGIDLTMTDDGIVFRRNNSDIKASHGLVIKAEDGLVMPDESNIDGEDPKKPPKYPKSIKIKDGRVKNPITGKPFNGNKSGDYDYLLMHEVVHNAKKYGIDPYNFLAMAMQETTLGKAGGGMTNPFHILNSSTIESKMDKKRYSEYFKNKTDRMRPVEMAANFYKNVKLLDKPKKKNPNIQDDIWDLQSWNGYGSIYPTTEQHIDGGGDRYGVSIPKEGINMSKNPMYGIWVKDLSNIFRDSKEVNDLVTRIYGPNAPAPYPDRIINDDVSE